METSHTSIKSHSSDSAASAVIVRNPRLIIDTSRSSKPEPRFQGGSTCKVARSRSRSRSRGRRYGRSRSRSRGRRSRSFSPRRSRSGSPRRSRSGSVRRSKTGSLARSRSASRSPAASETTDAAAVLLQAPSRWRCPSALVSQNRPVLSPGCGLVVFFLQRPAPVHPEPEPRHMHRDT
ncbi:serine/arginine-rich splicing factor SR34A-like isoform X4 [Cyprinus carpio]|uniref:Serine/arginine-rich splicing factor SR34A-like isoform X4 n=1 Tax=Cyprinus carpio TaxID=7962 RepID=A0A9Q9YN63_CYPCA|nr:serine/arginine-rich splicing factor SR34A-like isoform X4 [Cyprinus carpio]